MYVQRVVKGEQGYSLIEIALAVLLIVLLSGLALKTVGRARMYWNERRAVQRAAFVLNGLERWWDQRRDSNGTSPSIERLKAAGFVPNNLDVTGMTWEVRTGALGEAGHQPISCLYAPITLEVRITDPSFSGRFLGPETRFDPATHTYILARTETQPVHSDYFAKAALDGCMFRSDWGQP